MPRTERAEERKVFKKLAHPLASVFGRQLWVNLIAIVHTVVALIVVVATHYNSVLGSQAQSKAEEEKQ